VTIHLSIMLFWPLALAFVGTLAPRSMAPLTGLVATLVPLGYAVLLLIDFDASSGLQYVTDDAWIEELGIHYKLGVDGLNLWLIALTSLLFAASALWLVFRPVERPKLFNFHLALAETAVLGAFLAQDLALFVGFFDLMLIPFYFLVGQWGGPDRVAATIKLVIYTLVGSLLMLAAAVATAVLSADERGGDLTFVLSDLTRVQLPEGTQRWVLAAFALAFLIKMPAFPVHGWMPDAYRAMPLPVLAVFSGVVSKVAAYGFLRIVLPVFPDAAVDFQLVILLIGLVSILYGSVQAFTQTDARLILGYSSVAQLGFITLGIFALEPEGAQGAILQMVNHGLVVAPLFFIIALLAERAGGSEDIRDMGGISFRAPVLAGLFLITALATLAMPGSANFMGEFLILLGVFKAKLAIAIIAFTGVALASVYMLRAFIRTMHNRPGEKVVSRDLSRRDAFVVAPLVAAILAFAVYPQQALEQGERSARAAIRAAQDVAGESGATAEARP
jgi:NADH-quinone oxidoreductase subunit M